MMNFVKSTAIAVTALAMISATASQSFAADRLEIRDFIGTINWSNGPMSVEISKNAGDTEISGRSSRVIDGRQADIDGSDCKSVYGRYNIDWFGKRKEGGIGGYEGLKDFPVLDVSLPENTKLVLKNSIIFTDGAPDIGGADLDLRFCGKVTLGDVNGEFALSSRGSADVYVGKTEQFVASLKGSGDVTGGDSQDVLIKSQGSADVELGNLGSLEASLHGSGDLSTGDVDGEAILSSHGSGDIDLGDLEGDLSYSSHGSGDLEIATVNGRSLDLASFGSGDIDIGGGKVGNLKASVRGSAMIDFSGEAQTAILKSSGSGDIYVDRVNGSVEMKTSGSGDIDIGDRN